jgi:hypothetical protein
MNMIIGGLILLLGIRITFYTKTLSIKNTVSNTKGYSPYLQKNKK